MLVVLNRVRLVTGLVLLAFVTQHLVTLAMGLSGVAAMDAWTLVTMQPVYHPLGRAILYGAAALHVLAGVVSIARRRSLDERLRDLVLLATGLAIVPLIVDHVLYTRVAQSLTNGSVYPTYRWIVAVYWQQSPGHGLQQVIAVLVIWTHGCLGLQAWLSLSQRGRTALSLLYPVMVGLPVVCLLGLAAAGDEVTRRLAQDPAFAAEIARYDAGYARLAEALVLREGWVLGGWYLAVTAACLPLLVRVAWRRWHRVGVAEISWSEGPTVTAPPGLSLLQVALTHGVPHAHACGGRGRCGTCRVAILPRGTTARLSRPNQAERAFSTHLEPGAQARLACQTVILGAGAVALRRLVAVADEEQLTGAVLSDAAASPTEAPAPVAALAPVPSP